MNRDILFRCLAISTLMVPVSVAAQDGWVAPPPETVEQVQPLQPPPSASVTPSSERVCNDAMDEDADGLIDCADADCFDASNCSAGGSEERTDAACSDWIDNDGDAAVDCDDSECQQDFIHVCRGSWTAAHPGGPTTEPDVAAETDELVELGPGQSLEDLIGTQGDVDGERNDEACSDGIDNDLDGRTDCQDFGCRYDPQVTICQSTGGMRFSVVAGAGARITLNYNAAETYLGNTPEAGFTLLQLRAFGSFPLINNSFFLVSARADDSFRVSFALFQLPISTRGHYLQVNSGSGTLSTNFIISSARQGLLDAPFYVSTAFEQGNGMVLETGGPIDDEGHLRFRVFGGAGDGGGAGTVGGRFAPAIAGDNFSYTFGAQLQVDVVGHYDRMDTPYLYTPVPLTVAFLAGAKFDQRPREQFTSWHAQGVFRWWHFLVRGESYSRYVLDYNAVQTAWNVLVSALIVPRTLLAIADIGGFYNLSPYGNLPAGAMTPAGVTYQPEQFQFRIALHWYYFRSIAILSLLYSETHFEHTSSSLHADIERVIRVETRFRF